MFMPVEYGLLGEIAEIPYDDIHLHPCGGEQLSGLIDDYSFDPILMSLESLFAVAGLQLPNFDGFVPGGRDHQILGDEGHRGNRMVVAVESAQTIEVVLDVPYFYGQVTTARQQVFLLESHAVHLLTMSFQSPFQLPALQFPNLYAAVLASASHQIVLLVHAHTTYHSSMSLHQLTFAYKLKLLIFLAQCSSPSISFSTLLQFHIQLSNLIVFIHYLYYQNIIYIYVFTLI